MNGRMALQLVEEGTGAVVATATVNIPDAILENNEILIKNYTENEGMLDCLVNSGIIIDTGKKVHSGFVKIPICIYLPE
jgi:hypothetical protein